MGTSINGEINMGRLTKKDIIVEQQREIYTLRKRNESLEKESSARQRWLHDAKRESGFNTSMSFDRVWKKVLESYKAQQPAK